MVGGWFWVIRVKESVRLSKLLSIGVLFLGLLWNFYFGLLNVLGLKIYMCCKIGMGYQMCSAGLNYPRSTSVFRKLALNHNSSGRDCSAFHQLAFKGIMRGGRKVILNCMAEKFWYGLNYSSVLCHRVRASSRDEQLNERKVSDSFFETVEELERMVREPADILEEMQKKLSIRDLNLVLVYFSQEGRDSWCALEVFDWMRREDKVDNETVELMAAIMGSWLSKLVEEDQPVEEVQNLLRDMNCVGLKLSYGMVKALISLYWDRGKKLEAIQLVKYLLQAGGTVMEDEKEHDPVEHLLWKMSMAGEYREAVKLVFQLRSCGLRPKIHIYVSALIALVIEQIRFTRAVHELKAFQKKRIVAELETDDIDLLSTYQRSLHDDGEQIVKWAIEENVPELMGKIHEQLVAMYTVARRGTEAEHHLWQMKLAGREPATEMYNALLAVCAVDKNLFAVERLLAGMEASGKPLNKKTFSWLVRGYVEGGHFEDAAEALLKMLDRGLYPKGLEMALVLKGLQRNMQKTGDAELYLKLCKHLSDVGLIEPCLIYLYIDNLCIIRML